MKKGMLALAACTVLCLGLAGCGDKEAGMETKSEQTVTNPDGTETKVETTAETTVTTSPADAATSPTI